MSEPGRRLWWYLRSQMSAKFRRQVPLGPYIADFVCFPARLVVEVDGVQHIDQAQYDQRRDDYLASLGFTTECFWTYEMAEIDIVFATLATRLAEHRPKRSRMEPPEELTRLRSALSGGFRIGGGEGQRGDGA
jgi:very-short-patch-repair endonuclease